MLVHISDIHGIVHANFKNKIILDDFLLQFRKVHKNEEGLSYIRDEGKKLRAKCKNVQVSILLQFNIKVN